MSEETMVPMSKLLDKAIELLLKESQNKGFHRFCPILNGKTYRFYVQQNKSLTETTLSCVTMYPSVHGSNYEMLPRLQTNEPKSPSVGLHFSIYLIGR